MKIFHKFQIIAFTFVCIFLSSCSGDEGITDINNPELVTIAFFDALYNEKDIKKAALFCEPQLARIILHYRSANSVGRHLFNMSYDSIKITLEGSGTKVRQQFSKNAKITVYLDGLYNGERIKDIKRLALVQQDNKWIITKILKDPF